MSEDTSAWHQFQHGFGIVVFHLLSSASVIFEQRRVKSLLIGCMITLIVVYIITLPIRLLLFIAEIILSLSFMTKAANVIRISRTSITFSSVFGDVFWYIPLFILFISRTFGLFSSEPFDEQLQSRNEAFSARLLEAENKQTLLSNLRTLSLKIAQLVVVSTVLFILRLIPGLRMLVSLFILGYQLYKKVFRVNYHINNMALTMIGLAVTMLFSHWASTTVLYLCEFYLTSQALSREFLTPYFCKITRKMEKEDKRNYQWLLFGFGSAMTMGFAVPLVGLIAYPVFQRSAADVLVTMVRQKRL